MTVEQWTTIKSDFTHALLVGNGASVALHPPFRYGSLLKEAREKKFIDNVVDDLFDKFQIEDFELLLRHLHHAKIVNDAFAIESKPVQDAYAALRKALVEAVQSVHCSRADVQDHLMPVAQFMTGFRTVFSLNYDLIIYWASLASNQAQQRHKFKDCFPANRYFDGDWRSWWKPYGAEREVTLVFYPHGGLQFILDGNGDAKKLTAKNDGAFLEDIFRTWERNPPLIVCDGDGAQKLRTIRSNDYLSTVLDDVLPESGPTLVTFGWGFGDQERHILERIGRGRYDAVAVSVHNPRHSEADAYMQSVKSKLSAVGVSRVVFFDAASPGAWNNPVA